MCFTRYFGTYLRTEYFYFILGKDFNKTKLIKTMHDVLTMWFPAIFLLVAVCATQWHAVLFDVTAKLNVPAIYSSA